MAELGRITPTRPGGPTGPSPLDRVWRTAILSIGGFSFVINLLNMVIPIYSLQVFDRVLGSRSTDTLIILTIGIAIALALMGVMELIRSRIMVRLGTRIETELGEQLFAYTIRSASQATEAESRPLRDLFSVKSFLTGPGLFSLLDIPWAPMYLLVVLAFDVRLGAVAIGGALLLLLVAFISDLLAKGAVAGAEQSQTLGRRREEIFARNAEAMEAMGITDTARQRWKEDQARGLLFDGRASRQMGLATTLSHMIRLGLQVAFIGTGAYLVIHNSISIGIMVACMILGMRGLAPFESAAMTWRGFNAARAAKARLNKILEQKTPAFDAPSKSSEGAGVVADKLVFVPAGHKAPLFKGFSFKVGPGQILGVAGFNGAGKSTLLKLIMGIWAPSAGAVKIDDVDANRIDRGEFGSQVGYLPQEPTLFPGTIAENIARLGDVDMRDVVQAAELAGIHRVILGLPEGYETKITEGGRNISAGQRQLIALAASLYGRPRLLLLDEPTSALDTQGLKQVARVIDICRKAGVTTFVVSHDRELLLRTDAILCLANGQIQIMPTEAEEKPKQKADAKPALPAPQPGQAVPADTPEDVAHPQQPIPGMPQAAPGQPVPGQPMPGQPMPGQLAPGQMPPGQMPPDGGPVPPYPPGYPPAYPPYAPPGYGYPPMPNPGMYPGYPMPGYPPAYPQTPPPGYPVSPPGYPPGYAPGPVPPRAGAGKVYEPDPAPAPEPEPPRFRRKPDVTRRSVQREAPPQTVHEAEVDAPEVAPQRGGDRRQSADRRQADDRRGVPTPGRRGSDAGARPQLRVVGGIDPEAEEDDKGVWS